MVVKKDDLYKEVSKLFKRFEEVEKEIGNYTKPEGCRIFKREILGDMETRRKNTIW